MSNVAERIKSRRKTLKWTQARLAEQAGMPGGKTHISKIEKGRTTPTPETLEKLANALGVSVGYFFKPSATSSNDSTDQAVA